jgi:hypothetical protein
MSINQGHQRLCARERQQRALALRRAGYLYDSIARELGYRTARAHIGQSLAPSKVR